MSEHLVGPERSGDRVWHEQNVDEKLQQHKSKSRRSFLIKIALISLAVLISLIILIACLATLLHRNHHNGPSNSKPPVVQLDYGTYQGNFLSAGVHEFLGMRFAAPPTGDLRWRAPSHPFTFDGTQNATVVSRQPCHVRPLY